MVGSRVLASGADSERRDVAKRWTVHLSKPCNGLEHAMHALLQVACSNFQGLQVRGKREERCKPVPG